MYANECKQIRTADLFFKRETLNLRVLHPLNIILS